MTTLFLVRHGEVHNPAGIIYGRLPGYGLSAKGREQLTRAAAMLAPEAPFAALYASPLQRAQESAGILAEHLHIPVRTDDLLMETGIDGYQGKTFAELPRPYITEDPVHDGIECASSIRRRLLRWVEQACQQHANQRFLAVSHRDPIAIVLSHWQQRSLSQLPDYPLEPGAVHRVDFKGGAIRVTAL